MKSTREILQEKLIYYRYLLKKLLDNKTDKIEGTLNVSSVKNNYQYYISKTNPDNNKKEKRYIPKKDIKLAQQLAQQEYEEKLIKNISLLGKELHRFLRKFDESKLENSYTDLHPGKQVLVQPAILSYEQKIKIWKAQPYKGKSFSLDDPEIYTKKGERVRSKSEKFLADFFFELKIEYKYECPIEFENGLVFYPDFTLINKRTLEEVYWEHHGKMDDKEYCEYAIKKIKFYEMHGIKRSNNLIITFESSKVTLDMNWARTLIQEYLF